MSATEKGSGCLKKKRSRKWGEGGGGEKILFLKETIVIDTYDNPGSSGKCISRAKKTEVLSGGGRGGCPPNHRP